MQCSYFQCLSDAVPDRAQCMPHLEKRREYERRYRENHRPAVQERGRTFRQEHADHVRLTKTRRRHTLRLEVIDAYGGACVCCGEDYPPYLQLDHVNGGGNAHRRNVGSGDSMLYWLRRQGYPPIVQVLCGNCHNSKSVGYPCLPHSSDACN